MNNFTMTLMEGGTISYTPIQESTEIQVQTVITSPRPINMTLETSYPKVHQPAIGHCVVCRGVVQMSIDPWSHLVDCTSGTSQTKIEDFIWDFLDPKSFMTSSVSNFFFI